MNTFRQRVCYVGSDNSFHNFSTLMRKKSPYIGYLNEVSVAKVSFKKSSPQYKTNFYTKFYITMKDTKSSFFVSNQCKLLIL